RVFYSDPGLIRSEAEGEMGGVVVMDLTRGVNLVLDPAKETALTLTSPPAGGAAGDPALSMIDDLRRLAAEDGKPVGERDVGDVRARGFLVEEDGQKTTVWVDPETASPVLVDIEGVALGTPF